MKLLINLLCLFFTTFSKWHLIDKFPFVKGTPNLEVRRSTGENLEDFEVL